MNGEALPAARIRQIGPRTWRVDVDDSGAEHVEVLAAKAGEQRVALAVNGQHIEAMLDERAVRGLVVALYAARQRAWTDEERGQ